ncbi:MAG: zinc ribbon domain-containing protein [Caldilineales bacterium]|nr:zinc ribbon domain-containing protein [Caldilineales bacterium]
MIDCRNCGKANADDTVNCAQCGEPLGVALPPPRLLAQIQGLIPPEPIISTGRRSVTVESATRLDIDDVAVGAAVTAAAIATRVGDTEEIEPVSAVDDLTAVAVGATITAMGESGAAQKAPPPPRFVTLPDPEPAPPSPWSPALVIIAAAMILAILIGQFLPAPSVANTPHRPDVELAYSFIEILPRNANVLLAWDYEPTVQGEMQLLAQPILNHLTQKQARIANVSLRPTGPAVAADAYVFTDRFLPLSAQVARPAPVSLGFLPGDAAALQALALAPASISNLPESGMRALGLQDDDSLSGFQLIIEFSAETAATQEWVEQITTRQDTPFLVAASGAIGPALRPYQQTGQIAALIEGYTDALAYEVLLGQDDGPAAAIQPSWTLALLVVLAATLLGIVLPERLRRSEDDDE